MSKLTAIKYIGKRAAYTDGTFGTRIQWKQGQTRMVPDDKAALMLRHTDVYALGDANEDAPVAASEAINEDTTQDVRDSIANMDKVALVAFATSNYRIDLDKRQSVEKMRAAVVQLVDQFGAA